MANEYRIYHVGADVLHEGGGETRIYAITADVLADLGPIAEARVYGVTLDVLVDPRQGFFPTFIDDGEELWPPMYSEDFLPAFLSESPDTFSPNFGENFAPSFLDDSAEWWAEFLPAYVAIPDLGPATPIEWNPYRPHIPEEVADMGGEAKRYFQHQAETLRQQHNLTQAGDTTFDHTLLFHLYAREEYTLGSLGRFKGNSFGIIHARFVRFQDCVSPDTAGIPAGWVRDSGIETWTVSTDFNKSDTDLVAGISFTYKKPDDGMYGWVVVDGLNPGPLKLEEDYITTINEPLNWVTTGELVVGAAKSVGRVLASNMQILLPAGTFLIQIERITELGIQALVDEAVAPFGVTVGELETEVDALSTTVGTHTTQIAALTAYDQTLLTAINLESTTRARDIASVRDSIASTYDWGAEINNMATTLRAEFTAADSVVMTRANEAYNIARNLQVQIGGSDLGGILSTIADHATQITIIGAKFATIDSFDDVDTLTVPPTDRQVLMWDNTNLFWEPGTLTADDIAFTPAGGIAATSVQDAIEELDTEKASLSGATFTGDVSVPDEAYNATSWNGSVEVPTKNAIRDKIESMSGGSSTLTPPLVADFPTTLNTGTATTLADTDDGMVIAVGTGGAGTVIRGIFKTLPAAPYELITKIDTLSEGLSSDGCGLFLRDSATGRLLRFGIEYSTTQPSLVVQRWTNDTTFLSTTKTASMHPTGAWLRVVDDNTNLTFYFGISNSPWLQFHQESRTAWLAAANQYGFAVEDQNLTNYFLLVRHLEVN